MLFAQRHVESRLTAFLDHELSSSEHEKVARHLESCDECREIARSIARLRLAARFVPEFPPPAGLAARLERRLFPAPGRLRPTAGRRVASMALGGAVVAIVFFGALRMRRPSAPSPSGSPAAADSITAFDRAALRLHRQRLEGSLSFEICDSSRAAVRDWVCREAGLDVPRSPITLGRASATGSECAAIVPEAGGRIAVVALEVGRRPVTLLTTRDLRVAAGERRREGLVSTRRDVATGLEVESWVSGGQAYAAVSQGSD